MIAWTADLPGGEVALAIFNLGHSPAEISQPFTAFRLKPGAWQARDVWTGGDRAGQTAVRESIPPHGCLLLTLRQ